jgi:acetoin:2,6-dichlorophenolindophenol oxidoreductase subunit alpha
VSPVATAQAAAGELTRISDPDLDLLLLIRNFEQALLDLFAAGTVSGTTHSCLGQEYIPVAMRTLLRDDDHIFSNHRGHGHYLARFDDPAGLLAEIMGRQGGVCDGVGGSQHIHRDRYLSTGVQGESLPVAAGVALHLKRAGGGSLAAVYIGDGTFGEGAVYEALNMAQLWRLPLLVIVENNHIAQSTPSTASMAGTVESRAAAFGITHRAVTSKDISEIRDELAPVVRAVREQPGPAVVEFDTVRLGPHSKGDDSRDAATLARARAQDWYRLYAEDSYAGDRLARADAAQRARVAEVIREVEARPPARWEAGYPRWEAGYRCTTA